MLLHRSVCAKCVSSIQETGNPKILLMVIPAWASFTQNYSFAFCCWKEGRGAIKEIKVFFKNKSWSMVNVPDLLQQVQS